MLKDSTVFGGFSVNDLAQARQFYGEVLGLELHDEGDMGFMLHFANGGQQFVYPKDDHQPATYTVLNFQVEDIDAAVDTLIAKGVAFEYYHNDQLPQDDKGVMRGRAVGMGPDIAWFKDPAGNVLAVLQE